MSYEEDTGHREVVFDTETTGFDARGADRITEIGCIEIIDLLPTGRSFHAYLDPLRDVPEKVTEITGLTTEFLRGKPLFKDEAQGFLDFVGDSPLVAHNADFDMGFVNAELKRAGFNPIPNNRFIDTLKIARSKFPGSPASLDALCKRFDISLSARDKHGAIVDSELLAAVYLELRGGRARNFIFDETKEKTNDYLVPVAKARPMPLAPLSTQDEQEIHKNYIDGLSDEMLWHRHWNRRNKLA
ncbi:MAG: DNA polymerase III subunit epsilon [Maricaulaceae bacterium]